MGIKELQRTISSSYITDALYREPLYLVLVFRSVASDLDLLTLVVVPTNELIHLIATCIHLCGPSVAVRSP